MALWFHSWAAHSGRGLTCCPAIKPEVTSPEVLATNSQLNLNMSGVHPSPLGVAMETKEEGPQHLRDQQRECRHSSRHPCQLSLPKSCAVHLGTGH